MAVLSRLSIASSLKLSLDQTPRMEEFVMTSLPAELHGYHVNIYYDDATLPVATKLRTRWQQISR